MGSWELERRWDLRVSREEVREKGSVDLGVLSLVGLPAKAWDWRRREDMVVVERRWWWWWRRRENERRDLRKRVVVVGKEVEEERKRSIGIGNGFLHLGWLARERESEGGLMTQTREVLTSSIAPSVWSRNCPCIVLVFAQSVFYQAHFYYYFFLSICLSQNPRSSVLTDEYMHGVSKKVDLFIYMCIVVRYTLMISTQLIRSKQ